MASVKAEYIGTTTARFTPDKKAISKVSSMYRQQKP
jgi:hypothetical protein